MIIQRAKSALRIASEFLGKPKRPLGERFPEYRFGRGTYGDDLTIRSWGEGATLRVGAFSSIASGVQILLGGEHRTDWVTTFPFSVLWQSAAGITGHPKTKGDVIIGSDVWIGTEALVTSGVTIGDGAVVAARAVVTKSVAPYTIVAGNPARAIRPRFKPDQIERLLEIRWWDWPDNKIERALVDLLSDNIEQFINRAQSGGYDFAK